MKRIQRRIQASEDLDKTIAYYRDVAGTKTAEQFLAEYDSALQHIALQPGTGSRRYATLFDGVELCFWTLDKFPYAVFYIEHETFIDIVRVLHQASDLPAHLAL